MKLNKNPNENEITDHIHKIDWIKVPELERKIFSSVFVQLELATLASIQAETVSRGRLSSLIITLVVVLLFSLLGASSQATVMAALVTQALVFLVSQVLESRIKKMTKSYEGIALENVKLLSRRYPVARDDV